MAMLKASIQRWNCQKCQLEWLARLRRILQTYGRYKKADDLF
jgi:hypothetical protein